MVKPEFFEGGRGLMPEFGAILTAKLTQTTPYVGPRVLDGGDHELMSKLMFAGGDFMAYRVDMEIRMKFYLSYASACN